MERIAAEVFPPGEFLRDELEARGWTQAEFAEIIGRPPRLVNEIIAGKRGITPETAREFAAALGTTAHFWMNLESAYQLSLTEPAPDVISRAAKLRERLPVREIAKRGWVEPSPSFDVFESRVLSFFNMKSADDPLELAHAARRTLNSETLPIQIAWICRVRQLASALRVSRYSEARLRSALSDLESLMTDPEEVRHVPRILSECGVRFVVVEPIPGSKIDGVCMWIDGDSPVIGMSLRLDRIDNFWFVLRHEIEHVLRGDAKDGPIIDELDEIDEDQRPEELAANAAASDFCVPEADIKDFIARLHPIYSEERLRGFSRLMKRHTGIVAGQLRRRIKRYDLFSRHLVKVRQHLVQSALTDGYGQRISSSLD